ncbi:uncharacterized protein LOC111387337 [Olea europaea var. sylvestris]|uniref:uncharacterized protein LOC111387337 n=1 Tax=Olea europaea var. sylvestris TaxID=158386 RepID=UPI000C1D7B15|nr:uncharacterized protein LOC111387337 [Olea europaea var. sylvestris]
MTIEYTDNAKSDFFGLKNHNQKSGKAKYKLSACLLRVSRLSDWLLFERKATNFQSSQTEIHKSHTERKYPYPIPCQPQNSDQRIKSTVRWVSGKVSRITPFRDVPVRKSSWIPQRKSKRTSRFGWEFVDLEPHFFSLSMQNNLQQVELLDLLLEISVQLQKIVWAARCSLGKYMNPWLKVNLMCRGVDLRSSKVCELGLLNYKANYVFYAFESKKYLCHYDYYWASVLKVEYIDHSRQARLAVAEAPNEAPSSNCRPNFGAAWMAKDKFKVNEMYECWYSLGISKVNINLDGLFDCQAKELSTVEKLRRYSIVFTRILKSWFMARRQLGYGDGIKGTSSFS